MLPKFSGVLCATFVGVFIAGFAPAKAVTYDWTFVCLAGSGCSGGGTLETSGDTLPAPVVYLDGAIGGNAVTLSEPGAYGGNDNLLLALSPDIELTRGGLGLHFLGGGYAHIHFIGVDQLYPFSDGEFTVSLHTPIPAALPLFATGLAGLGVIAHRRRRKQVA